MDRSGKLTLVRRALGAAIHLLFFVAPWADMNGVALGGGETPTGFALLRSATRTFGQTLGLSADVSLLHLRGYFFTLISVPALGALLIFLPRSRRQPWALATATLLAGSLGSLLVRLQRHINRPLVSDPWYAARRGELSSLASFAPVILAIVVGATLLLGNQRPSVALSRALAILVAILAFTLSGREDFLCYHFEWGIRVVGLASALAVLVESFVERPPEPVVES